MRHSARMKRIAMLTGFALAAAAAPAKETISLNLEPGQRAVLAGPGREIVIKIDLTAAAAPDREGFRQPVNLAVVLDRSGSMSGAKIEKARQAALAALRELGARDRFALAAYDTEARVIIPSQTIEDRETLAARISRIQPGGSTALHAGVESGAGQLLPHAASFNLNRILLLSDGLANVGPSSPEDLAALGRRLARRNVAVSTIGLGDDYNEDLMAALAESGAGNYYYVQDTEKLASIFAKELGKLLHVVARNVVITITCADGVTPIGFLGLDGEVKGPSATLRLGHLSGGQNRYALLRCRLDEERTVPARDVAGVEVRYDDDLAGGRAIQASRTVQVAVTRDPAAARASENRGVLADQELLLNALAKDAAIACADSGNLAEAVTRLKRSAARFREATADAPAARQADFAREADSLEQKAAGIETEGYDKRSRKLLQSESYIQKNQMR